MTKSTTFGPLISNSLGIQNRKEEKRQDTPASRKGGRSIIDKYVFIGQEFLFSFHHGDQLESNSLWTSMQTVEKWLCEKNTSKGDTGIMIQAELELSVSSFISHPSLMLGLPHFLSAFLIHQILIQYCQQYRRLWNKTLFGLLKW